MAASFGHVAAGCLTKGCPSSPDLRERFGCDEDSERGFAVECWSCQGAEETCRFCRRIGGIRGLWFHRCPRTAVSRSTIRVVEAASEEHILPAPGGLLEQAFSFLEARRFVRPLIRRHEELEIKRRRRKG